MWATSLETTSSATPKWAKQLLFPAKRLAFEGVGDRITCTTTTSTKRTMPKQDFAEIYLAQRTDGNATS
jgi:hypothetical protein